MKIFDLDSEKFEAFVKEKLDKTNQWNRNDAKTTIFNGIVFSAILTGIFALLGCAFLSGFGFQFITMRETVFNFIGGILLIADFSAFTFVVSKIVNNSITKIKILKHYE